MSDEEIKKTLQVPLEVFANMVMGTIAKPTDEQIKNLYPHLFNWIPIEQELPEIDQIVWLYNANTHTSWIGGRVVDDSGDDIVWFWGNTYGSFWHNGVYWSGDIEVDHFYQPTHWMPLPELPAKEEL